MTITKSTISLCLFLYAVGLVACKSTPNSATAVAIDSVYSAGLITKPDSLRHTFLIKNTGNVGLVIDSVAASCDCTASNWQKEPIKPGATGFIKVAIKPNLRDSGNVSKFIMVKTNAAKPLSVYRLNYQLK